MVPTDIFITHMMPSGSEDSANSGSGNWRGFLILSPEQEARVINSNEPVPPATPQLMLPEGGTSEASTSGSLTWREVAVINEKEAIRTMVINDISKYLDLFDKEIISEFPKAAAEIGTNSFMEHLRKELVKDYGLENPALSSLTTVKEIHAILKKDFAFLGEDSPEMRNNVVYDHISFLLKDRR
jgi:hypothetical protein